MEAKGAGKPKNDGEQAPFFDPSKAQPGGRGALTSAFFGNTNSFPMPFLPQASALVQQPQLFQVPQMFNFSQNPLAHNLMQFTGGYSPSLTPFPLSVSTFSAPPSLSQSLPTASVPFSTGPGQVQEEPDSDDGLGSDQLVSTPSGGRVRSTLQMTNFLSSQMRQYNFFKAPKSKEERSQVRRSWEKALRDFNDKFDLKVSMTAYRRKVSHLRRTTASREASGKDTRNVASKSKKSRRAFSDDDEDDDEDVDDDDDDQDDGDSLNSGQNEEESKEEERDQ